MIRRIDPDEAVTINGVSVTGRTLAEARQELSHRGVHNPRWAELSQHDQDTAAISAGSWLRALSELVGVHRAGTGRHGRFDECPVISTYAVPAGECGHGRWNPDNRQCLDCGSMLDQGGMVTAPSPSADWNAS